MFDVALFQFQDIIDWITSHWWVGILVFFVIIAIAEPVLDFLSDALDSVSHPMLFILGAILTIIVGAVCYLMFGLVPALIAAGILTVLGIIIYYRIGMVEYQVEEYHEEEPQNKEQDSDDDFDVEKLIKKTPKKNAIKLKDIAGLEDAKKAISVMVILPAQHPEVYAKYNKKVGGGILLYGLPGTGKTMFAQAVANELNAVFYEVKCSDISSKWYGESEQRIKKLFQSARRKKRAVIFFDEFEAIGKSRNSSENSDFNIVPELLAQIQGFSKSDSTLLLLAATNRPWDIDSALLRPGRFNVKILIPLPDDAARQVIIEKQLRDVPMDEKVSVDDLVRATEGFNGADVVEFCDQLKNGPILRSIDNKTENEKITTADVKTTSKRVKSSVSAEDIILLEEFRKSEGEYSNLDGSDNEEETDTEKPAEGETSNNVILLKDIAGLEEAKEAITMRIILPVQHPDVYAKYNKKVGGGILLYGLPGTGKTMFAQAVANELDAVFYEVKCSDIASKWYGESEQRIKKLFQSARKNKRAVIFFDEFEALGKSRNSSENSDFNIVPELLAQIQGFTKNDSTLLLLAATNRPWDIDSALLRPGRFNEKILIPLPDDAARRTIIEKQLRTVPIDGEVSIDDLVMITEGFNGADVVEFCDQLKNGPILRSIDNKTDNEKITKVDVENTSRKVKSSVSSEDILLLEEFEKENP